MAEFLADAAMRPSSTGTSGAEPRAPFSLEFPAGCAEFARGAAEPVSPSTAGLQRSAGAEGLPHRCAGAGSSPTPGADTGGGGGGLCSEVLIPDKRGGGAGGMSLRQLNFCHVSLFLLKGVITAIQLQ